MNDLWKRFDIADLSTRAVTRRSLLRHAAGAGLAAAILPLVSACGGDGSATAFFNIPSNRVVEQVSIGGTPGLQGLIFDPVSGDLLFSATAQANTDPARRSRLM